MNEKEARWIRLREIAKIADAMLDEDIIDKSKVRSLDTEVTAMIKQISFSRKFFKRIT